METQEFIIDVNQQCIDDGEAGACYTCPVALAFSNAGFDECRVDVTSVAFKAFWSYNDDYMFWSNSIPLPISVEQFINFFDLGLEVSPFTFTISVPMDILPKIRKQEAS